MKSIKNLEEFTKDDIDSGRGGGRRKRVPEII
jgi:hypothetical protein